MESAIPMLMFELSKVIIGLKDAQKALLLSLLTGGHVLLEGNPGLGKTTLAKAFAQAIGGTFKRIQMTPDLLPADIIGTAYYDIKTGEFKIKPGPIFANVVLVDELNRASPRTQAALLEVMQEGQATIEGVTLKVPRPFMVIATQVPYGAEGTYPLTDVQIDRFAAKVVIGYPTPEEEVLILNKIDYIETLPVKTAVTPQQILEYQKMVKSVYVDPSIKLYIVDIVRRLRELDAVKVPPSPRASIWLYKFSRAQAFLEKRKYVIPDDVKSVARYVLEHRVVVDPELELEGITPKTIIEKVLAETPVPKG